MNLNAIIIIIKIKEEEEFAVKCCFRAAMIRTDIIVLNLATGKQFWSNKISVSRITESMSDFWGQANEQ